VAHVNSSVVAMHAQRHYQQHGRGGSSGGDPRVVFPGLGVRDLKVALERFAHAEDNSAALQDEVDGDTEEKGEEEEECPICLESLSRAPPSVGGGGGVKLSEILGLAGPLAPRLLSTPCGDSDGDESALRKAQSRHCFHATCLAAWLRRSCRCPLCKTDLRPFLRK